MVKMDKATIHWAASSYNLNEAIKESYNKIFDHKGNMIMGNHSPEHQVAPYSNGYAAHCSMTNHKNVGYCLMGMAGYNSPKAVGDYPITAVQLERMLFEIAKDVIKYEIPLWEVKTHYERGKDDLRAGRKTKNIGKIDIVHIPVKGYDHLKADEIGPTLRNKISWYINRIRRDMKK